MSISVANDRSVLILHDEYVKHVYRSAGFEFRSEMFEINTPYVMDSEARKEASSRNMSEKSVDCFNSDSLPTSNVKKKKKSLKKYEMSYLECMLEETTKEMVALGSKDGYFKEKVTTGDELVENNKLTRSFVEKSDVDILIDLSSRLKSQQINSDDLVIDDENISKLEDLENHLPCFVHCETREPVTAKLMGEWFILPPNCSFLLGDVSDIEFLVHKEKKFDLILMDPPWKNKSVKRKRGYAMLEDNELKNIPVNHLSFDDCLVVVWTTNNNRQMTFIKEVLFPHWSVVHCADWHWVKVTRKGEYVCALNSPHKKPYENLIIGQYRCDQQSKRRHIERRKVIISVPSGVHSHKPPLTEVLKPYLPENPRCLELFARYLLPGWTSCGNEVLKMQHLNYFRKS